MTILIALAALAVAIICGVAIFLQTPKFGGRMRGERLERALRSPNYRDGRFHNPGGVAVRMDTSSAFKAMKNHAERDLSKGNTTDNADEGHSGKDCGSVPGSIVPREGEIPVVHCDLQKLDREQDAIVWFGHSSYLLQVDGVRFLVDPVFYVASPVRFINRPFPGMNEFSPADMPEVDYLVITHDHWDHLDHRTVKELSPKVGRVICPLGVGAHFERWGYAAERLIEMDWGETAEMKTIAGRGPAEGNDNSNISDDAIRIKNHAASFSVECLPAQHFSGRGLRRNATLWASYMLRTPGGCIYLSGDGGYGPHFRTIGERYPSIRLAILENGQYNELWRPIHIMPDALPRVIEDLGTPQTVITVHHSKYALSRHPWDEPRQTEKALIDSGINLLQLRIGEVTEFI